MCNKNEKNKMLLSNYYKNPFDFLKDILTQMSHGAIADFLFWKVEKDCLYYDNL